MIEVKDSLVLHPGLYTKFGCVNVVPGTLRVTALGNNSARRVTSWGSNLTFLTVGKGFEGREVSTTSKNKESMEEILQPGVQIRPIISPKEVSEIVQRLYGLRNVQIAELNAYDDKNYYIQVPMELIAQNHDHVVRLLTYQPGSVFQRALHSRELFFSAGQFVAKLDQTLKGFHHPAYESYSSLWELRSAPLLRKFLFAVREEERKHLVEEVLHSFEKNVLPSLETFEKGLIHGDFNEQNILVSKTGEEDDPWQITAILDFGDTHISCYLFELAITLCYMMLLPCEGMDPLDVGAHVLAGYSTVRAVPATELQSLKVTLNLIHAGGVFIHNSVHVDYDRAIDQLSWRLLTKQTCICTRLCQSLVMGEYSHLQDPGNDYLLTTAKTGWGLLQTLWGTEQDELERSAHLAFPNIHTNEVRLEYVDSKYNITQESREREQATMIKL
uniref:Hydroxylysine kinase n=1 Tax=Timema monikensis TaxID=170555 RepID=A0A7R9E1E2_9NEOP|nr:unnamed protein product [Timema monikensis]